VVKRFQRVRYWQILLQKLVEAYDER
jgi:hypothetical protein